jgi:lipopolysaccharide/colanic/teichoic acid biosynthesis glycosyltransferase
MTPEALRLVPSVTDEPRAGAIASVAPGATAPRVWGLSARQLHDAYWRAQGVECVRRGEGTPPEPGADAYLLLEPDQLVVFDLREIAEPLQWTRATLCRLRVVEAADEAYRERVRLGDDGLVKRIERVYSREVRAAYRVLFTDRVGLARAWSAAPTRREGWLALRRTVSFSRTDDFRVHGRSYRRDDHEAEGRLLSELVNRWSDPERAIDGIEQISEGIVGPKGTSFAETQTVVGPLWLGVRGAQGSTLGAATPLIGPAWIADDGNVESLAEPVRLLPISEILSPDRRAEREAANPADRSLYLLAKRTIDIAVSLTVLVCILPILLVVGCAVVVDDGWPVFFGHRRQTTGGRIFHCWKFRTMRRNAEALAKELRALNVCDGPQFFIRDDPRVTRVGKVLRKWHLDELPQFWNVLVGDMSLVGPRPSPDGENQFCPAWRELRLSVRPGITGLWQVERTREPGRDFQEWIRFDIEYVNRASLALDVQICVKTILNIIGRGESADRTSNGPND